MRAGILALAASLALHSAHAFADEPVDDTTRNAARHLAEQGRDAFEHEDFERSRDLFHRAYALVQAPTLALYEARSLSKLGRLVQAEEAYLRALRTRLGPDSPQAFRKAVHEAESEAALLAPRVPKLTIVITGPGADSPSLSVTIDHEPVKAALLGVEMPLNPGSHGIEARVPSGPPSLVQLTIQESERKRVEIRVEAGELSPASKPPLGPKALSIDTPPELPRSRWHKPVAFAAGGVGVVGVGTGIIAGLMATSRHAEAEEQCPVQACVEGSDGEDALRSFRTLRTVSTTGYIVGALGLAAGVTLFLVAPSPKGPNRQTSLGLRLSPGGAGLIGAF